MSYNTANSEAPYFSVLIPSYNRPEYIAKCIESILDNDFDDYEIIISDDNSPKVDEIEESIKPYLGFENVHFFKQNNNLKEPGNKNFLIGQAKGAYNIIIGDDDKLYPDSLRKIKESIDKHPMYDLYAFGYTIIDENDKFYYSRHASKEIKVSLAYLGLVRQLFISDVFPLWLYHPATYCCKNGLEKEIPYSKDAGIGEDLLFLFDFINNGKKMFVIPESLFFWRKIQNQGTEGQKNQSLGDFSNVQARKNIYYHLLGRKDLNPYIANLTSEFQYRKRFLYNSILADRATNKDMILSLNLDDTHFHEFEKYSNKANYFDIHYKPYIKRSLDFIHLFGVEGLFQIGIVSFQRLKYKFRMLFRS